MVRGGWEGGVRGGRVTVRRMSPVMRATSRVGAGPGAGADRAAGAGEVGGAQVGGGVDWGVAARVASRAARPGRGAGRDELDALVAGLRAAAAPAAEHAARVTRLEPADGRAVGEVSRVLVVDRAGWTRANARMLEVMSSPSSAPSGVDAPAAADARAEPGSPAGVGVRAASGAPGASVGPDSSTAGVSDDAAGRRPGHGASSAASRLVGGAQLGAVLAVLSSKVLGQFDPFTPPVGAPLSAPGEGRLLLVAPNVLHLERSLRVEPADFRLWVALHEQTHALQFAAAPWLAGYLRARSAALLGDVVGEGEESVGRMVAAVGRVLTDDDASILDVLSPDQRTVVDEVGAVMSLLEGHADVAMDAVGRRIVPSVREIRRKFEARRDSSARARGPEGVLRRLLGMDAKLAQYREGAAFVRAVRSRVGVTGLNAVFAAPENLPRPAEIADPGAWVRRVHG